MDNLTNRYKRIGFVLSLALFLLITLTPLRLIHYWNLRSMLQIMIEDTMVWEGDMLWAFLL